MRQLINIILFNPCIVYTYKEIIKLTFDKAEIKRLIMPLPWSIFYIQGFLMEFLPPNFFTITRDQVRTLQIDNIVSNDPNILRLSDLGINPTPAEKVLLLLISNKAIITIHLV